MLWYHPQDLEQQGTHHQESWGSEIHIAEASPSRNHTEIHRPWGIPGLHEAILGEYHQRGDPEPCGGEENGA